MRGMAVAADMVNVMLPALRSNSCPSRVANLRCGHPALETASAQETAENVIEAGLSKGPGKVGAQERVDICSSDAPEGMLGEAPAHPRRLVFKRGQDLAPGLPDAADAVAVAVGCRSQHRQVCREEAVEAVHETQALGEREHGPKLLATQHQAQKQELAVASDQGQGTEGQAHPVHTHRGHSVQRAAQRRAGRSDGGPSEVPGLLALVLAAQPGLAEGLPLRQGAQTLNIRRAAVNSTTRN
mmetsp:Transcript_55570/g.180334  ORF Transcript_55570/g.180334 Transcript_55570/m.180334 type:complete len:241 (-) Transcript_55570:33-755(-)